MIKNRLKNNIKKIKKKETKNKVPKKKKYRTSQKKI